MKIPRMHVERKQFSVFELCRHVNTGRVVLNDQHPNDWDQDKKSLLIESMFCGAPIGSFVFSSNSRNRNTVIIGNNRIRTMMSFLNNGFRLENLEIAKSISGLCATDIGYPRISHIEDYQIYVDIVHGKMQISHCETEELLSRVKGK